MKKWNERVVVAVPTYRRPTQLAALLPLLEKQLDELAADSALVLVIDNDLPASARLPQASTDRVALVHEPTPGISAARNRALHEATARGARLLVFIDDDERPEPGWLRELVAAWERFDRPVGVAGQVLFEYQAEPNPWLEAGEFFTRRSLPTGTEVDMAPGGNLLIDLDQVNAAGLRFADDLGLTGGEDTLFTRQLARTGGRLIWCDEARVTDLVPQSRLTRRWALNRARSHGNGAVVVALRLEPDKATRLRVGYAGSGTARMVAGAGRYLLGLARGSVQEQAEGARLAARGFGVVTGALGHRYQEYARPADHASGQSENVGAGSGG